MHTMDLWVLIYLCMNTYQLRLKISAWKKIYPIEP